MDLIGLLPAAIGPAIILVAALMIVMESLFPTKKPRRLLDFVCLWLSILLVVTIVTAFSMRFDVGPWKAVSVSTLFVLVMFNDERIEK